MNTGIQILFEFPVSILSFYKGIELLDLMVMLCLRNDQSVFHSDCTNLQSHQKCMSVPIALPPQQHLSVFDSCHATACEALSQYSFDFQFPHSNGIIFVLFIGHL